MTSSIGLKQVGGAVASTLLLIGNAAAAPAKEPRQATGSGGTVDLIYDGGGWVAPVQIGGQTVYLNIDTGSSDLWTGSTELPADVQSTFTRGQVYDPSSSTTYQQVDGSTFGIFYADGSGSSGNVGTDVVQVGGAVIPSMPFGVCNNLTYGSGESSRDTEGPIGLGFGAENSIRPTPQCTFMECLEPYVDEPIFGTRFRTDNSSTIDFGFSDSSKYTGDQTEVPIGNTTSGNEGQWVVQGVTFGSDSTSFDVAALDMDFDTGTTTLSVSSDVANAYWALVSGSDASSCTYPCGSTLPDFTMTFPTVLNGGPSSVTIPGDSLKNGDASSGTCSTWMNVVTGRGNGGLPVYISKYMIWNQQKPSLTFVDQA